MPVLSSIHSFVQPLASCVAQSTNRKQIVVFRIVTASTRVVLAADINLCGASRTLPDCPLSFVVSIYYLLDQIFFNDIPVILYNSGVNIIVELFKFSSPKEILVTL